MKLNSFSHTFSSNFLSFDSVCSFFFLFLFHLANWKISSVTFSSIFRSLYRELFCQTAVGQNITKIDKFLQNRRYSLQNLLTNLLTLKTTGSFLVLWSKGLSWNFTKQLFFLHSREWFFPIIYWITAMQKLGRWKIK